MAKRRNKAAKMVSLLSQLSGPAWTGRGNGVGKILKPIAGIMPL